MPSKRKSTDGAVAPTAPEKRVRIASDPPAAQTAPVASTSKAVRKTTRAVAPVASTSRKASKSALKTPGPAHPASVDDAVDEALLGGFEGDEDDDADSSDDDAAGVAAAASRPAPEESIPASSLPAIARDDADVKRKLDRAKKDAVRRASLRAG